MEKSEKNQKEALGGKKWLLEQFDRFFIFEFYVRYLRKYRLSDLNKILELKTLIETRFSELKIIDQLAEFGMEPMCLQDFPDIVDITLEGLTEWTLNSIQFRTCHLEGLCTDLASALSPDSQLAKDLVTPFLEFLNTPDSSTREIYFKFSDITKPNDIVAVYDWWCLHLDEVHRKNNNLIEKYGLIAEEDYPQDQTTETSKIHTVDFDIYFTSPKPIYSAHPNFFIHKSGESEITIDGQSVSDSLALVINYKQPIHNLEKILNEYRSRVITEQESLISDQIYSAKNEYDNPGHNDNQILRIKLEIDPPPPPPTISKKSNKNSIIKKYDSITKNLKGLIFYDIHMQQADDQSIETLAGVLINTDPIFHNLDEQTIKSTCNAVVNAIKNIAKTIEKNDPFYNNPSSNDN